MKLGGQQDLDKTRIWAEIEGPGFEQSINALEGCWRNSAMCGGLCRRWLVISSCEWPNLPEKYVAVLCDHVQQLVVLSSWQQPYQRKKGEDGFCWLSTENNGQRQRLVVVWTLFWRWERPKVSGVSCKSGLLAKSLTIVGHDCTCLIKRRDSQTFPINPHPI